LTLYKYILMIILSFCINDNIIHADPNMVPYILDGKFVLYFPSIKNIAPTWEILIKKMSGPEYERIISKIHIQIKEKMSRNILNPKEAELMGLDSKGGVAYVHLKDNLGYIVFTIKNKKLLQYTLDNLLEPIPYRIEGNYIILSASDEILDYYEFKGLHNIKKFKQATEILKFNWQQNFIWLESDYFIDQGLLPFDGSIIPQGDRVAGIFQVNNERITLNLYTLYSNPEIKDIIKYIIPSKKIQRLSFLDYEVDIPAIVGQTYLNIPMFIKSLNYIDRIDALSINKLIDHLNSIGINLKDDLFPYIQGKVSYLIREYNILENILDFTISMELNNSQAVKDFLLSIVRMNRTKKIPIKYKTLFTQEFFGWNILGQIIWTGVVEGNLLITSSEAALITLVHNIYEDKRGMLNKLPALFKRSIINQVVGGQIYISSPQYIQNIKPLYNLFPFEFNVALHSVEWDFSFIQKKDNIGRQDVIRLFFLDGIKK